MDFDDMRREEIERDFRQGITTFTQYQKSLEKLDEKRNGERDRDYFERGNL
jgi:hypothetical protein